MIGPCFGHEKIDPAVCRHPPTAIFGYYAEDYRGRMLVSICFACNTILTGAVDAQGELIGKQQWYGGRKPRKGKKDKVMEENNGATTAERARDTTLAR